MPDPLKKFRVQIELEITVNSILRESFQRVPKDATEEWVINHMGHQQALQWAILANPDVLEPYLRTIVSGYLDGHGEEVGLQLFGGQNYASVEDSALGHTPPETIAFFSGVLQDDLMAEHTNELMGSFAVKTLSGTISEL